MLMRTAVCRIWAIALVLGLCISALPPYIGVIHEVAASWSPIPGQDCKNVFSQVWNNTTDPNSSLREEPRDIFVTEGGMDLDWDMFPEIVVGDASGWFYVYENNGSDDGYTEVYSNITGGSVVHAITCGDLDGDNDMEIVTGGDNNQIRIYEWDKIPESDNFTLVNFTNLGGVIRDLEIEDVDWDGKNELVVGWDDGISIYEFNNTFHFGMEYFYATGQSISSITTGDFDGDMTIDIAAGEHNYSSIYVFESIFWDNYNSVLNAPLQLAPFDAQRNTLCIEAMDLDGDGKYEIISGDNKGNLSVIRAYHDINSFSYSNLDTIGNSEIWDLFIDDADGDSRMDIYVAAGHNASVFDYELITGNLSYLSSYDKILLSSSLGSALNSSPCSIFVGDADLDGKSEVIVGCFGNANDSMLFVLEREVLDFDVTVESINFPSHEETLPTGTYTINATLKNLGKDEATVNASCVITDSGLNPVYTAQENFIMIPSGGRCYVAFDLFNWTGMGIDTYDINVSIEYLEDMNVDNNYRNVTLHILDIYDFGVGGMDISGEAPYGEGENISISSPIHNPGNVKGDNVPVYMMINDSNGYYYNDTDQTTSIEAGDSTNITFVPDWIPPAEGNYTVNVSVMWNLDHNRTNNHTQGTVTVKNNIDISADINSLINPNKINNLKDGREIFNTDSTVVVNATIENLGNKEETFDAILNITDESNASVFTDTVNLTVGKGGSVFLEFNEWDTGNISHVNYTVNVSVHEPNENQQTDNNYSTRSIWVWDKFDLSATNIELNRSQPINSNTSLNINSTIKNIGNMNVSSYHVRLEIRNSSQVLVHSENKQVNTLLNRSEAHVASFQMISPLAEDDYSVNVSVVHPDDVEPQNNYTTSVLSVDNLHDIDMNSPYFEGLEVKGFYPTGSHNFGATAYNGGNRNESFDVSIKAGSSSGNNATLFQDDIESGTGSWSHLSWKGDDLWHQVNSTSQYSTNHSADTSWWFGDESTGQYKINSTALLYHSLDLGNAFYASVSFWVNYSLENGDDYFYFVINNDSASDPYNATWTEVQGPYTGNSGGWGQQNINISLYAGQKVQIGFYVFSNVTGANYHGIYVDDIVVSVTETNFVYQNSTTIELASNSSTVISDSFNFVQEDTYIITFESTLLSDESYCNDVAARKVNILDYYDVGTTGVALTMERKEEMRYFYDFEGVNGADWVHGGTNDDWARGPPFGMLGPQNAHSPINVWGTNLFGQYSSDASSWLRTPLLRDIEWGSRAEFYLWYGADMTEIDKLQFQVSDDGGNSWTTLKEYTGSNQIWEKQTIYLGDFYKNIHCRFLFTSDDNFQEAGFYIDDFKVVSKYPIHALEDTSFDVTIRNFGNLRVINPDVAFTVTNDDQPQFNFVDSFAVITTLAPGDNHTFAWHYFPPENGSFSIDFSTDLPADLDNENNGRLGAIKVWNYTDIQMDSILSPVPNEVVRQGDTIDITVHIKNYGTWDWKDIPINFNITSREKGLEVIEDIGIHLLSLERNESGNVTHQFTLPYGQGVRYYVSIQGPFDIRLDMDFSNNIKNTTIFGLNLGELPALFGYVNSSRNGDPLPGATVSLANAFGELANTITDRKGFYWFSLLMFDELSVEVSKEKYYTAKGDWNNRGEV